jgi:hypothetical protein
VPPWLCAQLVRAKAAELESLLQRLADVNDAIPAHGIGMARSHTVRPEAGGLPQGGLGFVLGCFQSRRGAMLFRWDGSQL